MIADQVLYTSCRQGKTGHAGFQVRSISRELPSEDEREIIHRGGYERPTDSPPFPENALTFQHYPVAFRSYRVASGRLAVTRAVYAGQDGGGRPGNFLAHTLVLEGELPPDRWPVDLLEWPGWHGPLDPEERDSEAPPPELPVVDLDALPAAESFSWRELAGFLDEDPRRREWLAAMIDAVLLGPETSRPVLIKCAQLDAAFWIACLQKTLPSRLATRLSFSSYQFAQRGCADVNVTSGATRFALDDTDRRFRFFVFDWDTGQRSDVEDLRRGYGARVLQAFCESPEDLEAFHRWVGAFEALELEQLPAIWATHGWLIGAPENPDHDLRQSFALFRTVAVEARAKVHDQLWRRLADPAGDVSPGDLQLAALFFLEAGEETADAPDWARGLELWLRLLVTSFQGDESAGGRATELWSRVEATRGEIRTSTAVQILDASPWDVPRHRDCSPALSKLLLELTVWALRWGSEENPWASRPMRAQLAELGDTASGRRLALSVASPDAQALTAVLRQLLEVSEASSDIPSAHRDLGRALAPILEDAGEPVATRVRRNLEADSRWNVLFGEWLAWLTSADRKGDRTVRQRQYAKRVLRYLPDYEKATRGWRAASLLDGVPTREQRRQAVSWLDSGELARLPPDLRTTALRLVNEALSLAREDVRTQQRAQKLAALAADQSLRLSPDRAYLLSVLQRAEQERLDAESLRSTGREMGALGNQEAAAYLERLLPLLCARMTNFKEHLWLLESLADPGSAGHFEAIYSRTLFGLRGRALVAAVRFWLSDHASSEDFDFLEESAWSALDRNLVRLPPEAFETLDAQVAKAKAPIKNRWQAARVDIARRREGPAGRTVRWFANLKDRIGSGSSGS